MESFKEDKLDQAINKYVSLWNSNHSIRKGETWKWEYSKYLKESLDIDSLSNINESEIETIICDQFGNDKFVKNNQNVPAYLAGGRPGNVPWWRLEKKAKDEDERGELANIISQLFDEDKDIQERLALMNEYLTPIKEEVDEISGAPLLTIITSMLMFVYDKKYIAYRCQRMRNFFNYVSDYKVGNNKFGIEQYLEINERCKKILEKLETVSNGNLEKYEPSMIHVQNMIWRFDDILHEIEKETKNSNLLMTLRNKKTIKHGLKSKGFLIFPGISGTGKTQIAREVSRGIVRDGKIDVTDEDDDKWCTIPQTQALDEDDERSNRIAFLPVRPNWNESSQIWGNFNPLTGKFQATDALKVLLDAYRWYVTGKWNEEDKYPSHFIILDEMNLARVEYYFSDVLSLMESGIEWDNNDKIQGETAEIHTLGDKLIALSDAAPEKVKQTEENGQGVPVKTISDDGVRSHQQIFQYLLNSDFAHGLLDPSDVYENGEEDFQVTGVPPRIGFPPNLGIIGTVNVDETTHSFAPKVLDRSFVVEFNDVNYEKYLFDRHGEEESKQFVKHLKILRSILEPANLHFGYRTVKEMIDYADGIPFTEPVSDISYEKWDTWDQLLSSKVLPKIHGRQDRISGLLNHLFHYAANPTAFVDAEGNRKEISDVMDDKEDPLNYDGEIKLEQSSEKLKEMYRRMTDTGHASFF